MRRLAPHVAFAAALLPACSSARPDADDLAVFRASHWRAEAPRSEASPERIDSLRDRQELIAARDLALDLAEARPGDPAALWRASRAESDFVVVTAGDDGRAEDRENAAWSALDLAERAIAAEPSGPEEAAARAQLAWAQGAVTHLLPMFDRADHARVVERSAHEALASDPEEPVAWATLATLRLRLATLPFIADLFAVGAPEASLDDAIAAARRSLERAPSLETAILLAKALDAAEREDEAATLLREVLDDGRTFPRDRWFEEEARRRGGVTTGADVRTTP